MQKVELFYQLPTASSQPQILNTRLKILLVDDDYLLAKGTARLLQRLGGHEVIIAENPDEIITFCQSGTIDIVMMDVNLPGAVWEGQEVSGADLTCWLKNQAVTKDIPIILVTAYAMTTERQALLKASQADDFLLSLSLIMTPC